MLEINNKVKAKINKKALENITRVFLKKYKKKETEVSLAFVSDAEMKKLNKIYRGVDKTTDVLSFEGEEGFLGEIIISSSQVKRQASEEKKKYEDELTFIFVHGLLHLVGFDDKTERERLGMIRLGEEFIKSLNNRKMTQKNAKKNFSLRNVA